MYTFSRHLFSEAWENAVNFAESSGHANHKETIQRRVHCLPNLNMFLFDLQLRILDGEVLSLDGRLTSRGTLDNEQPRAFLDPNLELFHQIIG